MNRNTENHFGNNPSKSMPRSAFKMSHSHTTSFSTGNIIPIYWKDCLPGDSVKMNVAELIRMTTPIHPVMDNAYIDTYFFKVPRRLVYSHFEELMGENKDDAWTPTKEYELPQVTAPQGGWAKGSLADYFGIRTGVDGISIDASWFRAYALIYNEWFRSEALIEPAEITMDDTTTAGSNGTDYVTDLQKGGMPAKAGKMASYYTRALPEPQRGPDIFVPLGDSAPVIGTDTTPYTGFPIDTNLVGDKISFQKGNNTSGFYNEETLTIQGNNTSIGLSADLTQTTGGATINALRQAFAIQRLYELDATSGGRYIEQIRGHFKVNVPDARLQRPEYVGGKRVNINMMDVINTSSAGELPLGHEAGESKTIDNSQYIETAFVEHTLLIGLAVVRTDHSYQQRIPREFSKKKRLDFYYPELANLGEQAILNKEIYVQGTAEDEEVFGYQEAWAEYRYEENYITSAMNSDYAQSLDSMHYGDDYDSLPTLSQEWIVEPESNVARTLAIQNEDQFIAQFYFDSTWYRPLPIYSIPSLQGWF